MTSTVMGAINVVTGPVALWVAAQFLLASPTLDHHLNYLDHERDASDVRRRVDRYDRRVTTVYRSIGWAFFWFVGIYGTTTGVLQLAGIVG